MIGAVYRSVLPLALKYTITTEERSASFLAEIQRSVSANYYTLTPLLVSAWKQKAIETYHNEAEGPVHPGPGGLSRLRGTREQKK